MKSKTLIMKKNEPLKNNQPSMSLMGVLNMVDQLNNFYSNDCYDCGNERLVVKFEDLPEVPRKAFAGLLKMPVYKVGATFLYCNRCDQYSILSGPCK